MANVRKLPQDRKRPRRKDVFDVDALEQGGKPTPFVAVVGGEEFTFADPNENDWQDLAAINPNDLKGSLMSALGDQYEAFTRHRLPMWKLNALSKAVEEHYAAWYGDVGEDDASSTSSGGTARR